MTSDQKRKVEESVPSTPAWPIAWTRSGCDWPLARVRTPGSFGTGAASSGVAFRRPGDGLGGGHRDGDSAAGLMCRFVVKRRSRSAGRMASICMRAT